MGVKMEGWVDWVELVNVEQSITKDEESDIKHG
jgi:hypothetical protein